MAFVSVRTNTLRPNTKLLFDVYVHYREEHLRYRQVSQAFDDLTIERLKSKKIKKVFIPEEQEPAYLQYLDQSLNQLQEPSLSVASRAEFAQDTLRQASDTIDKTLETEEAYRSSESRIHQVVDFMLKEPKALAGMLASAGLSVDDSAHGATVSSLALAVGTASKFVGREELTDLAVAGLLHDTALKSLGFDATTTLANLPKEKRADFRRHPALAVERVAGKQFITPRVMRIIQDHEEYGPGLGFPEKKNYDRLQVDSQIFNICDAFDHFAILAGKPPLECVADFIGARTDHFDLQLLEILEKQVKS